MGSISVALHDDDITDLDNFIRYTNGSTLSSEVESYLQEWIDLMNKQISSLKQPKQEVIESTQIKEVKPKRELNPVLPTYIYKSPHYLKKLRIQKDIGVVHYNFGTVWDNLNIAQDVVDYLVYKQWDVNLSSKVVNKKGKKYQKWLLDRIAQDKEYQEYLKNKDGD